MALVAESHAAAAPSLRTGQRHRRDLYLESQLVSNLPLAVASVRASAPAIDLAIVIALVPASVNVLAVVKLAAETVPAPATEAALAIVMTLPALGIVLVIESAMTSVKLAFAIVSAPAFVPALAVVVTLPAFGIVTASVNLLVKPAVVTQVAQPKQPALALVPVSVTAAMCVN